MISSTIFPTSDKGALSETRAPNLNIDYLLITLMTSTDITTTTTATKMHGELVEAASRAEQYAQAATAQNTRRAYQSDWRIFEAWCHDHELEPMPAKPATVALYLSARAEAGVKVSTIERSLSAIAKAHKVANLDSPRDNDAVKTVMKGIRRTHTVAPQQVAPVLLEDLRQMIHGLPDTMGGARDRALLLLGFAGAFRRSELVGVDTDDLDFRPEGLVVTLRRSKTDTEGQGRNIGVPYGSDPSTCPVRALQAWLESAGIDHGAVFRAVNRHGTVAPKRLSDRSVALVVKRAAQNVGLDPARYAGHSLRAGLATSAAQAGKSERAIKRQTGHRSTTMVRRYIREADIFTENAAAGIGL